MGVGAPLFELWEAIDSKILQTRIWGGHVELTRLFSHLMGSSIPLFMVLCFITESHGSDTF